MKSMLTPILRYQDAHAAISWFCEALGFEVFLNLADENDKVQHCRLVLEGNMIMIASLSRAENGGEFDVKFKSPGQSGGVSQCVSLFVRRPEKIYQKALAADVSIVDELDDLPFGGCMFSCEDPESHLWVVTNHDPWQKTW